MGWGGAYLQGRQVRAAETEAEARRAMAERDFAMREASARRQSDVDRRRLDLERWQAGRAESEFRIKNDPFLSALPDLIKGFPEGADPALLDAAHDYYVDLIGQGRVTPSDPNGPEWMNAGGNLRPTSPGAQVPAATRPVGPGADQYPARASSGAPPMPALPMEMGGEQDAPVAADRRGTLDQAASRRLGLAGGASSALPEAAPTEMVPGYSSRPGEERPGYLEFGATASEPEQALGEQARHNAGRPLDLEEAAEAGGGRRRQRLGAHQPQPLHPGGIGQRHPGRDHRTAGLGIEHLPEEVLALADRDLRHDELLARCALDVDHVGREAVGPHHHAKVALRRHQDLEGSAGIVEVVAVDREVPHRRPVGKRDPAAQLAGSARHLRGGNPPQGGPGQGAGRPGDGGERPEGQGGGEEVTVWEHGGSLVRRLSLRGCKWRSGAAPRERLERSRAGSEAAATTAFPAPARAAAAAVPRS